MILIAAILKIVFWQFLCYQPNVTSLDRTRDMSLNKMIPLNGSPGHILSLKSQLQNYIEVKYVHKKYYNLAIENSFNRFLDLLYVGLDTKIVFLS